MCPLVTKEINRPFAPWMNNSIQEAMNIRNTTRVKKNVINIMLTCRNNINRKRNALKL